MHSVPIYSSKIKERRSFAIQCSLEKIALAMLLVNVPCTVHDGEGTEFTSDIPADFSEVVVVLTA